MKNKTFAAWLCFLTGPLGLHRFYLFGLKDSWGWFFPIPTATGWYGIERMRAFGQDDGLSWVLIPALGFTISICALNAIVYGLMDAQKWNTRFNPSLPVDASPGQSNWLTIAAIVLSLLVGTTVLMSSLAFSFQHYFEWQVEEARKISQ
jgi:hypothetical protein